jgi:hypothetical protein
MLTPSEIVASTRLRYPFDARVQGMSALEVLAMAVNDANASASKSATDAREAREALQRLTNEIAHDLTKGHGEPTVLPAPHDPTVWQLELRPLRCSTRMLSGSPSHWSTEECQAVADQVGRILPARSCAS